MHFGYFVIP